MDKFSMENKEEPEEQTSKQSDKASDKASESINSSQQNQYFTLKLKHNLSNILRKGPTANQNQTREDGVGKSDATSNPSDSDNKFNKLQIKSFAKYEEKSEKKDSSKNRKFEIISDTQVNVPSNVIHSIFMNSTDSSATKHTFMVPSDATLYKNETVDNCNLSPVLKQEQTSSITEGDLESPSKVISVKHDSDDDTNLVHNLPLDNSTNLSSAKSRVSRKGNKRKQIIFEGDTNQEQESSNFKKQRKKRSTQRKQLMDSLLQNITSSSHSVASTENLTGANLTEDVEEENQEKSCSESIKNAEDQGSLFLVDYSSVDELQQKKSRRGRPKANVKKHKSGLEQGTASDIQIVVCAVCNLEMNSSQWLYHKQRIHNNLSWRIGDNPLNLADHTFVMKILNEQYRAKRPLNCYKCGSKKKSVVGFLSHQSTCQKSDREIEALKVKCELCDSTMLPVSISVHMKLLHNPENSTPKRKPYNIVPSEAKRNAAKRANSLINTIKEEGSIICGDVHHEDLSYRRFCLKNCNFKPNLRVQKSLEKEVGRNGSINCRFEGCGFNTSSVSLLLEHMLSCAKKPTPNYYTCRLCVATYKTVTELKQHFELLHGKCGKYNMKEEYDDEDLYTSDFDSEQKRKGGNQFYSNIPKFLWSFRKGKMKNVVYPAAFVWTLQFNEQHLSLSDLYPNMKVYAQAWPQISKVEIKKYTPGMAHSIDFTVKHVNGFEKIAEDHDWMQFRLFESAVFDNGSSTIFCGGPVTSMAWVPTPSLNAFQDQILAVGVTLDVNKKFFVHKNYNDPGMIQFWNFGPLQNDVNATQKPELEFCICHDFGQIWQIEWCPSGCFDTEKAPSENSLWRMGLMAVAGSDSFVYVFAVPVPSELGRKKLIKPTPIMKLYLKRNVEDAEHLGRIEYHATKLCWSKASGHHFLAVGYSNGMVAIFNLKTENELLLIKKCKQGIRHLVPFRVFQAQAHAVTVLHLSHLSGGCRWLLTGSIDRTVKVWDLNDTTVPLHMSKKFVITDGVWLNQWLCSILCFDECACKTKVATQICQFRDYYSEVTTLLYSGATATSMSGSDWVNGIVQSNSAGEIVGSFPHQLLVGMENDKSLKMKKLLFTYTDMVDKHLPAKQWQDVQEKKENAIRNKLVKFKSINVYENVQVKLEKDEGSDPLVQLNPHYYCYEPMTYGEAQHQYGLVFYDVNADWSSKSHKKTVEDLGCSSEKQAMQYPNMYPLSSVNKVSFNPNLQSYVYCASGYQAGFIRLFCLRFLN